MSSEEIIALLRHKHTGQSWVTAVELRPSVGYKTEDRRIDFFALECSPSKGMPAHAFEVKTSRSDWLRELRKPDKRRMAYAISNYFWVAAPAGVVNADELPTFAGLLECDPTKPFPYERVKVIRRADYRDKVRPTWGLIASLLRKMDTQ